MGRGGRWRGGRYRRFADGAFDARGRFGVCTGDGAGFRRDGRTTGRFPTREQAVAPVFGIWRRGPGQGVVRKETEEGGVRQCTGGGAVPAFRAITAGRHRGAVAGDGRAGGAVPWDP